MPVASMKPVNVHCTELRSVWKFLIISGIATLMVLIFKMDKNEPKKIATIIGVKDSVLLFDLFMFVSSLNCLLEYIIQLFYFLKFFKFPSWFMVQSLLLDIVVNMF